MLLFFTSSASAFDLAWNANILNGKARFFDLDGSGKLGAVMPNGNGVEYRPQASLSANGTVLDVGAVVNDALAVDLNGDGSVDFVTANANGKISVVIALDANNNYAAHVDYAATGTPAKLWALDLSNDGYTDIVTLNSGSISIFINDGSGQFAVASGYSVCWQAREMMTADLNGDGFPDLVFPCYESPAVDIFINDGSGGFSSTSLVTAWNVQRLLIANFSGTGRQDLLAVGWTSASLFRNSGGGHFAAPVAAPLAIAAGDWDDDGKPDLAYAYDDPDSDYAGYLQLYRNTGSAFESYQLLEAPRYTQPMYLSAPLIFTDVNGDGNLDILLQGGCGECGSDLAVYFGFWDEEENLNYTSYVPFPILYGSLDILDLDDDGRPDIIAMKSNLIRVYTNFPGAVPRPFSFTAKTDVAPLSQVVSDPVVMLDIDSAPINIVGGEYSINGADFTSEAGTMTQGDSLRVRVVAPAGLGAGVSAMVSIGQSGQALSSGFQVTTWTTDPNPPAPAPAPIVIQPLPPPDTTPDAFRFVDMEEAGLGLVVESNAITIAGINAPAPVTIVGGEYRLENAGENPGENDAWTNIPGQAGAGQRIRVRLITAEVYGTPRHVTLTVGGISDTFTVTTALSSTVSYIPDATGLIVPLTVPVELLPASQNQRLPQTKCATAETRPAATYQFPPLSLSTLGQDSAPVFQTVEIAVPEAGLATGKTLAPAVVAGSARITTPPGTFVLSVSPCGRADGGYFRTLNEEEMRHENVQSGDAGLLVRRRGDGRLEVAIEHGEAVIYRATSAPTVSPRQQRAGVLPSLVGQNVRFFAGEVAEFDANGRLLRIRLGTLDGQETPATDTGNLPRDPGSPVYWWSQPYQGQLAPAGDQVAISDPRGRITFGIHVPKLNAPAARLDGMQIDQAIARTFAHQQFGVTVVSADPYRPVSTWGLRLQRGGRIEDWAPVGPVRVEPGRPDNAFTAYYGLTEVSHRQTVVALAPALPSLERFARAMRAYFGGNVEITLAEGGVILIDNPGPPRQRYALRPRHDDDGANRSCSSLSDALHICNGLLAWREPGETRPRPLFPAFASFTALQGAILDLDPNATVQGQEDGAVQAQFSLNGQTGNYTLTPDYQLIDIPADKAGLAWWWDGPTRIILSVEGKWAQGFGVR
ncbi:MAG: VCBS repeat-containing protein [Sulfuricellaceae bacterium]